MKDNGIVVRLYGDSLGMPRSAMGITFDKTYAELFCDRLRSLYPDKKIHLYNRSQGGTGIKSLFHEFQMDLTYFGDRGNDILILHLGIVDCAPRVIPQWLKSMVSRMPVFIRGRIIRSLHVNRPRLQSMGIRWQVTTKSVFRKIYRKWLEKASERFGRVYVLNILPTTPNIEKHSPGLTERIAGYNAIIRDVIKEISSDAVHFIDINAFLNVRSEEIGKFVNPIDGHHLTVEGNELFADLLAKSEEIYLKKERAHELIA